MLTDLAVLSDDYFEIEEDEIRGLESVLTMVGGVIVHAAEEFTSYNPELPPVSPDWSPVNKFGGYHNHHVEDPRTPSPAHDHDHGPGHHHWILGADGRAWQSGCGCAV